MNDLIAQLQECKRTKIAAKNVFGKYGLHFEEDVTKSLGLLTPQHAMTQVTTWILLHLERGESTEIRLTNPTTKDVYTWWCDYMSDLAWCRLGVETAELCENAVVDREVFRVLLGLLPP